MQPKTLLDTDVLSGLMRKTPAALNRARTYLAEYQQLTISLITRFEVLRGLKAKRASAQLVAFCSEHRQLACLRAARDQALTQDARHTSRFIAANAGRYRPAIVASSGMRYSIQPCQCVVAWAEPDFAAQSWPGCSTAGSRPRRRPKVVPARSPQTARRARIRPSCH